MKPNCPASQLARPASSTTKYLQIFYKELIGMHGMLFKRVPKIATLASSDLERFFPRKDWMNYYIPIVDLLDTIRRRLSLLDAFVVAVG